MERTEFERAFARAHGEDGLENSYMDSDEFVAFTKTLSWVHAVTKVSESCVMVIKDIEANEDTDAVSEVVRHGWALSVVEPDSGGRRLIFAPIEEIVRSSGPESAPSELKEVLEERRKALDAIMTGRRKEGRR